ncbi:hypothetical protein MLD38_017411 [Melastoma candidum]|uniref:Uncharacterized protein n=1 Tax=Melastoma candidum TaxID=119954 RepID=A0ACB9QPZ3_9MYRT|nr:hypothetical protein MLD38_017411 [Melastoma candidum]
MNKLEQGISAQNVKRTSTATILTLAYQSLGVVYGGISTTPLYVYKTTFSGKLRLKENDEEIYGVLSFVFWTLTLVGLLKYVGLVISADDNGEGGTFALYSLLCRHVKRSNLPNHQDADERLSTYAIEDSADTWQSSSLKSFLERHQICRTTLRVFVLLSTCMAIGDGILTPTISVQSAVAGAKIKLEGLHDGHIKLLSCFILVGLFSLQHHGTHKVAFMFAPIVMAWLLCISFVGAYNIIRWNRGILSALSPAYMVRFLRSTGKEGWVSLGGLVLSITGVEAMFANLGHFHPISIRAAFTLLVFPCLVVAYMGEAAFLSRHHEDLERSFYKAIPCGVFWPVFIVATLAAIVGSQAMISATFSLISQCCALNCFPRVKIIHTSSKIQGQVYIPEVNWMLMCLCLMLTVGLRDSNKIGHAYSIALTTVMFTSTCLMVLVKIIVWKERLVTAMAFFLIFGSVELLYFSAAIYKIPFGGWISLLWCLIFLPVMCIWYYGTTKKLQFDVENKVSMSRIWSMGTSVGIVRVPGIGVMYTDVVSGVPAIFGHFVTNLPAFHQVLVFVCIKHIPVPHVSEEERLLISRVGSKEYGMLRCIARYGYMDLLEENDEFENRLITGMVMFVESEDQYRHSGDDPDILQLMTSGINHLGDNSVRSEEARRIVDARESGVTYILGKSTAKAKKHSPLVKRWSINGVFAFLSKNCREPTDMLRVPPSSLMEVGMIYHV